MATTILVEPDPGGHRFQAVANVARVAARSGDVLLLTSRGATRTPAFLDYLGDVDLEVEEAFDEIYPPTREMATRVGEKCRTGEVSTVVVMDSDQALKRWWYVAPRALRGAPRPRVVFMVTRYPSELTLGDRRSWWLRVTKGGLVLAAMSTGSLHRAAGFAGRDNTAEGLLVKRLRDPDVCTAHSRDRAALRAELDLPAERTIAGIFGVVSAPKNARLIWEAMVIGGSGGRPAPGGVPRCRGRCLGCCAPRGAAGTGDRP